jgi:hypothetical protein
MKFSLIFIIISFQIYSLSCSIFDGVPENVFIEDVDELEQPMDLNGKEINPDDLRKNVKDEDQDNLIKEVDKVNRKVHKRIVNFGR